MRFRKLRATGSQSDCNSPYLFYGKKVVELTIYFELCNSCNSYKDWGLCAKRFTIEDEILLIFRNRHLDPWKETVIQAV